MHKNPLDNIMFISCSGDLEGSAYIIQVHQFFCAIGGDHGLQNCLAKFPVGHQLKLFIEKIAEDIAYPAQANQILVIDHRVFGVSFCCGSVEPVHQYLHPCKLKSFRLPYKLVNYFIRKPLFYSNITCKTWFYNSFFC